MKRLLLITAVFSLLLVPAAQAGKISVSASYDGTYLDLTICGTGSKTVEVRVIAPDGSVQVGQLYTDFPCATWSDGFPAPESGTYTIEVGNLQGHNTFAATTVTVPQMARIWHSGAEGNITEVDVAGTTTRDTGVFRSGGGVASFKCDSGAGNAAATIQANKWTSSASTAILPVSATVYTRVYMRFDAAPTSSASIATLGAGATGISARLTSGGNLQLFRDDTDAQIGSDSVATLATDGSAWYRIELFAIKNASNQITDCELRLDGVTVASATGQTIGALSTVFLAGWCTAPGANKVCYVDDAAANDGTGTNNSWCGEGSIILMMPISDNNRGNWTAGAGGTTNLFDAVNNRPPVGVADGSATNTSQIKIKSTSLPSSCDLNLDTYTNAGVSGTVNAVWLLVNHGEDPTTGTKAGTTEIVSNPASGTTSFSFGDDAGAQGTFVGNWKYRGLMTDAPSVTLGTAPVVRVTCTSGSTGTRAASCDFIGVHVDFTPAASALVLEQGYVDFADPGVYMQADEPRGIRRAWHRRRSGIFVPEYAI